MLRYALAISLFRLTVLHAQNTDPIIITQISPLTIGAGTGDTLTIQGYGFGAVRGAGGVRFSSITAPELQSVPPTDAQYVSWSDEEVRVIVPGSWLGSDGPCSGPVRILRDGGGSASSLQSLIIPVRHMGTMMFDEENPIMFADRDGAGGYTFHLSPAWNAVPGGLDAVLSALDRWACVSGVNWSLGSDATDTTYAHDGEQRITFVHGLGFPAYRVHRWYTTCAGQSVLDEIDIEVNADKLFAAWPTTPTATQWDLRTVLMGALGHALGLDEVIEEGAVMFRHPPAGLVNDEPTALEAAAAQQIVTASQGLAGCALGPLEPSPVCGTGHGLDADLAKVYSPRPGYCDGVQPVVVCLRDAGIATLTSAQIHASANGVELLTFDWSGSLAHGDSAILEIGDLDLPGGAVSFSVWLSDVNGVTDGLQLNDTVTWQGSIGGCISQDISLSTSSASAVCAKQGFSVHVGVSVTNGRPLTGCRIDHTVDGAPRPPLFWTGNFQHGSGGTIFLGTEELEPGTPHVLEVTLTLPNGVETDPPGGVTVSTTYPMDQLAGTYSVGPIGADYLTLTEALDELAAKGACDDVVFELQPGTYMGDPTISGTPLWEKRLTLRSITMDPQDVTITGTNMVLGLSNMKATVEGVSLQSSGTGNALDLVDCDSVLLRNCVIIGGGSTTAASAALSIDGCDHVVVEDVDLQNSGSSLYAVDSRDVAVLDCSLSGTQRALEMLDVVDLRISHNTFNRRPQSLPSLRLDGCSGDIDINDNLILGRGRGIELEDCSGDPGRPIRIWNDHVSVQDAPPETGALVILSSQDVDVVHNTFISFTPGIVPLLGRTVHILYDSRGIRLLNNIISNPMGAGAVGAGSLTGAANAADVLIMDHNAYYSGEGDLFDEWHDLAALQNFIPGQNLHSLQVDPEFIDPDDPDFHPVNANHALLAAGIATPYYLDRNGAPRPLYPTVGADQASGASFDVGVSLPQAGVLCATLADVLASIHNHGTQVVNSVALQCSINGQVAGSTTWNGTLAPGASIDSIIVCTLDLLPTDTLLSMSITQVDGGTDGNAFNDLAEQKVMATGVHGAFYLDENDNLDQQLEQLAVSGICGDVTLVLEDGTYPEELELLTIPGASEQAHLIITSASQQADQVIIAYQDGNVTLNTMDARHVVFDHVTIGDAWNTRSINALGRSRDFRFIGCESPEDLYFSAVNGLVVEECALDGLFINGTSSAVLLRDDSLGNATINHTSGVVVDRVRTVDRITLDDVHGADVQHSHIRFLDLGDVNGTAETLLRVASNRLNSVSLSLTEGAYFNGRAQHTHIHNNTITDLGSDAVGGSVTLNATGPFEDFAFYNNILARGDVSYPALSIDPLCDLQGAFIDHNCYYTPGGLMRGINGNYIAEIAAPDLVSWRAWSGVDMNSIEHLPAFVDTTIDVHIVDDVQLNGQGVAIPAGLTDIDGEARNAAAPDIGMDEFDMNVVALDAAPFAIGVENVACFTDNGTARIRFKNNGATPITSVQFNWRSNGSPMAAVNWSGTLAPDSLSAWISLGAYAPSRVLGDSIEVWVSQPNGQADLQPLNDTLASGHLRWPLAGAFTVGTSAPADVPTLVQTDWHLSCLGVCDAATFILIDDEYEETLGLEAIPGSSSTDTVTFRGASADSSSVEILGHPNLTYAIDLDGASHVRFKDVTVQSNWSSTAASILSSSDIGFREMHFLGYAFSNYSTGMTFDRCSFTSGTQGIYCNVGTGSLRIRDCVFNAEAYGVLVNGAEDLRVERCLLNGGDGMRFYGGWDTLVVNACRLTGHVSLQRGVGATVGYTLLSNNWLDGPGASCGVSDVDSVLIYHNSIRSGPSDPNGTVLYVADAPEARLLNNAIYRQSPGRVLSLYMEPGVVSDHNVLFGDPASVLVYNGTTEYADLAAWQQTGQDLNSLEVQPFFGELGDPELSPLLDERGTSLAEVPFDISGYPRDPLAPDAGADEFDGANIDLGAILIDWSGDPCSGEVQLQARLKNYGLNTITSALINVERDGVAISAVPWSGSLPVFAESDVIELGSFAVPSDTNVFRCWTSAPNGLGDETLANDTVPEAITVFKGMVGFVPVGAGHPYVNMHAITEAFRLRGICGPVTVAFESGTYEGQDTLFAITGSSPQDTVVFRSMANDQTAVILDPSFGSDPALTILGADHVTFMDLSFGGQYPHNAAIALSDSISGLRIQRCYFENGIFDNDATAAIRSLSLMALQDAVIDSCTFHFIEYGVMLQVSGDEAGHDLRVTRNTFTEIVDGIHTWNIDSLEIAHNNIVADDYAYWPVAIEVHQASTPVDISYNTMSTRYQGITVWGVTGSAAEPVRIRNNAFTQILPWGYNYLRSSAVTIENTTHTELVHNTGHVNPTEEDAAGLRVESGLGVESIVGWNNIWTGRSAVVIAGDVPAELDMHHDVLNGGDTLVLVGTTAYGSLAEVQNMTPYWDNSFEAQPAFLSDTEYHIGFDPYASGHGVYTAALPVDIDGEPHTAPVDIGCDEFAMIPTEAGAVEVIVESNGCDSAEVSIRIVNNGSDVVTEAQLGWQLEGGPPHFPIPWSGSLASFETSADIPLGSFAIVGGLSYTVHTWVVLPNGIDDPFNSNDTATVVFVPPSEVELGANQVLCISDTIILDAGAGFAEYEWSTGATTQTIAVTVANAYAVVVTDASGCGSADGIVILPGTTPVPNVVDNAPWLGADVFSGTFQWFLNGSPIPGAVEQSYLPFVNGWYSVQVTGADGCSQMSDPLSIQWVGVAELGQTARPWVAPNPADEALFIHFPGSEDLETVHLIDATGRTIRARLDKGPGGHRVPVADIAPGIYTLDLLMHGGRRHTQMITIVH